VVLHFTYSQDTAGNGNLDGFVMSDVCESGIVPAFLAGPEITATPTLSENGILDFSNTNISANFQSDVDVPEPASLALFGLGLAGLGVMRHRRAA